MTASPLQTVFDLAFEALEKREAADINCDSEWSAFHQAEQAAMKTQTGESPICREPLQRRSVPWFLEDAAKVLRTNPGEHCVALLPTNNHAYQHRRGWMAKGYKARTEIQAPGEYAVFVQAG